MNTRFQIFDGMDRPIDSVVLCPKCQHDPDIIREFRAAIGWPLIDNTSEACEGCELTQDETAKDTHS